MEIQNISMHNIIESVLSGNRLSYYEAYRTMEGMMAGEYDPVLTSSLLTALRRSMESPEEIAGFSQAMLDNAQRINYIRSEPLVDVVGTGGAKFKSFNVSTTSALILPGLGVSAAKHGNRSNSSPSGSADLLEALGLNIQMTPHQAEFCLNETGFTFMFAPIYHPAMKNVVPIRRKLKFRTIFNLLGPLTNPAGVRRQLTGLFSEKYLLPVAEALRHREYEHVILVHSDLGADEFTNVGKNTIVELVDGEIREETLTAESLGLNRSNPMEIASLPPEQSAVECLRILRGESSPRRDFTVGNVVLALRAAGRHETYPELARVVEDYLDTGRALDILEKIILHTGGEIDTFEALFDMV